MGFTTQDLSSAEPSREAPLEGAQAPGGTSGGAVLIALGLPTPPRTTYGFLVLGTMCGSNSAKSKAGEARTSRWYFLPRVYTWSSGRRQGSS